MKDIEKDSAEYVKMSEDDWVEQLEHAIKTRKSPAIIFYLSFFVKESRIQRNNRITRKYAFNDEDQEEYDANSEESKYEKNQIYNPDPLIWAVENEHWELFSLLIERNDIDINQEDSEGNTAVNVAIRNNRVTMLKEDIMKRKNFNSHEKSKLGSPLEIAISHKNQEIIDLIVSHEIAR